MITPMSADLSIDRYSVALIMKTFTKNTISTFLLGTTGESPSIPDKQKTVLVKTVIKENGGKVKIYAGISGNCLQESSDNGNQYADLGVDAVVAHLPFYYPISPDNMIRYFTSLAGKLNCPLILYNNPQSVGSSIPVEVVEKLSYHPNIAGIKDSERGMERINSCIDLWRKRSDFVYLLGWTAQSVYALSKGCDGIVPSTGNLTPELYKKLFETAIEGRMEEADKYQKITDAIVLLLFSSVSFVLTVSSHTLEA